MTEHLCPGPECAIILPDHLLACSGHWKQVPMQLRVKVYVAWDKGKGTGTLAHAQACRDAIAVMTPLT